MKKWRLSTLFLQRQHKCQFEHLLSVSLFEHVSTHTCCWCSHLSKGEQRGCTSESAASSCPLVHQSQLNQKCTASSNGHSPFVLCQPQCPALLQEPKGEQPVTAEFWTMSNGKCQCKIPNAVEQAQVCASGDKDLHLPRACAKLRTSVKVTETNPSHAKLRLRDHH